MSDAEFSPNVDQAEKGSSPTVRGPESPNDSSETNEGYSRNAKAWAMYLQEAGENAKEQAEVWKTGLESLLIFAGLFAGVITSFLAESRKKLQQEDQEAFLMNIQSVLRNEPPSTVPYAPTTAQVWVNGLWFTSLLVTLFSAIVAVLARSWLVNHLPISSRKEAIDAYKRWLLDERANRWMLPKVITGIPLLVQLAFFLFSLGLAVQTYADNRTLGIWVVSAVAAGTLLYLVVTALPLFLSPDSCPFHTPLSDFILDVWALCRRCFGSKRSPEMDAPREALTNTLTKILHQGLIKSQKPELVDEAIFELNRHPPHPRHFAVLASSDTARISIRRLAECTLMRFEKTSERDEIISAHLQNLLCLVMSWERADEQSRDQKLLALFEESVGRAGIFSRWDQLPESASPLTFAVRVLLHLSLKRDIAQSPLPGDEWGCIVNYIQPAHRLHVVISACRGSVQGNPILQKVSTFLLVHLIAQSYSRLPSGRQTSWNSRRHQKPVRQRCKKYLRGVLMTVESMWEEGRASFLELPGNSPDVRPSALDLPRPKPVLKEADLPPTNLLWALKSHKKGLWNQGLSFLLKLAGSEANIVSMEPLLSILFNTMFDRMHQPSSLSRCIAAVRQLCNTGHKDVTVASFSERLDRALKSDNDPLQSFELLRALETFDSIVDILSASGKPDPVNAMSSDIKGLEEIMWKVAPRVIAVHFTAKFPPLLRRWGWLRRFFSNPTRSARIRDRLQAPICSGLAHLLSLFDRRTSLTVAESTPALNPSEQLSAIAGLLEFVLQGSAPPLLDFNTLQDALDSESGVQIHKMISLIMRAAADGDSGALALSVFLALTEDWYPYHLGCGWDPHKPKRSPRKADIRDRMYLELREHLKDDTCEVPINFIGPLLDEMKRLEDTRKVGGFPTKSSQRVKAEAEAILAAFTKTRWKRFEAVALFAHLASQGEFQDTLEQHFPCEDMQGLCQNNSKQELAGALLVWLQNLIVNGWKEGITTLINVGTSACTHTATSTCAHHTATLSLLFLLKNPALKSREAIISRSEALSMDSMDPSKRNEVISNWTRFWILLSVDVTVRETCLLALSQARIQVDTNQNERQDLTLPRNPQGYHPNYIARIKPFIHHSEVQIQLAALEALAETGPEFDPGFIAEELANLAFTSFDPQVRYFSLRRLTVMASDVNLVPVVIKVLESKGREPGEFGRDASWGQGWAVLLETALYGGTFDEGLKQLVRLALKDKLWEVRVVAIECLSRLADDHAEALVNLLRNAAAASWDSFPIAREAWASALSRLSIVVSWKDGIEALIEMALNDTERSVRLQAYLQISTLVRGGGSCATLTVASLNSALDRLLEYNSDRTFLSADFGRGDQSFGIHLLDTRVTSAVLSTLVGHSVRGVSSTEVWATLKSVVSLGVFELQSAIVKGVVTGLHASTSYGAKEGTELLRTTWENTPSQQLLIGPFVHCLPPLLRHTLKHVRWAGIRILSQIPPVEAATSTLIAMVLEDPDEGIRDQAAGLLHMICDAGSSNATREILASANLECLLDLLSSPTPLSSAVAQLLGACSKDSKPAGIPRQIGLWIIKTVAVEREATFYQEQGALSLLCEIVSRGGLDPDRTLDYIVLLLASSLAYRGTEATEPYRPLLLASLSLHYQGKIPRDESACFKSLTGVFESTAFGKHGTDQEADSWLTMDSYLEQIQGTHASDQRVTNGGVNSGR